MISHTANRSLENYKQMKAMQKEVVDGKEQDKEIEITIRFDFAIPLGAPYETALEVLEEFKKEVESMRDEAKRLAEERQKEEEKSN